jgi:hypothetical protein
MPTSTPWGIAQTSTAYGRGVIEYKTARHGGFHVSPALNRTMPDHLRIEDGWYEEDADWARVALAFPDRFNAHDLEAARRSLRGEHDARLCFPIRPRCSTYHAVGNRCRDEATVYLYDPDGAPNPGGYVCSPCGLRVIDEYRSKVGEAWTLRAIHIYDHIACRPGKP